MKPDLNQIKTIIIVMMENRSFDHILGYLSLPEGNRTDVEGLSNDPAWLNRFTNSDQGQAYQPFLNPNPHTMPADFDPPHERTNVAANLGALQNGAYPMNGFVSGIPSSTSTDPEVRKLVMSYFGAKQVPISDFFARNFAICDQWFSALPAGTQPNRLMAMSGFSRIDVNHTLLPEQDLAYDWLNAHNVSWCVYHQGVPFFTMMPKWIPEILLTKHFRSFDNFESDLVSTPPDDLPQVIFIEPTYQDAPHLGFSTDEHAPSGISNGQELLMQVYNAVTNSPSFWKGAVMIVDYDEHGGFFDHVTPPMIPTQPPPNATYTAPFASLGVRTPAYVISPFVLKGSVSHALLDHTSVLKFLGEKFGNGSYSALVDARPVKSVSEVLNFDNPITDPPSAPALNTNGYLVDRPPRPSGATVPDPNTDLQKGFQAAIENLKQNGADQNHVKFGPLLAALPNTTPGLA
jgi:phospholipase C